MRDAIERSMSGDRDAFESIVIATTDRAYAVAIRILRDSHLAEDAMQTAFLTAWRELPRLRDPERYEAWFRRILVHACYGESRRRTAWAANVRVLPSEGPSGQDEILSVAERDALDRAFRRLKVDQRAVFVLHHYVGLPLVEIAATLAEPAGTTRARLHFAVRTLRAALDDDAALGITREASR